MIVGIGIGIWRKRGNRNKGSYSIIERGSRHVAGFVHELETLSYHSFGWKHGSSRHMFYITLESYHSAGKIVHFIIIDLIMIGLSSVINQ